MSEPFTQRHSCLRLLSGSEEDAQQHVIMTVTCEEGHIIGDWIDVIEEKYPFNCGDCGWDLRTEKYPWTISTEVIYITHDTYSAIRGVGGEIR